MRDRSFFVIVVMFVISITVFIGIAISQKSETIDETSNNVENVIDESGSKNNITEDKEIIDEGEVKPIENKVITEVNVVTDINSLTNPKIEEVAKNTFDEYFKRFYVFEKSSIGPMPGIFIELGFATENDIDLWAKNADKESDYIKSKIKHETFKNAMLQFVNEEYFIKYFSQYRNVDGYVAFGNYGGGAPWYSVEDAELISRVGNTYNFKITIKDLEMYDHYKNGDSSIKENDYYFTDEVAMEYVNDRLVISKLNDGIILEGVYSLENTDVAYEFYKDGTVEYLMNMGIYSGTYNTSGEKELKITWEEETMWDVITLEEKTSKMSGTENVTVINDKKIRVESNHDGEVVVNEFIKK